MEQFPADRSRWLSSKPIRLLVTALISAMLVFSLSGAAVYRYSVLILDEEQKTVVLTSEEDPYAILQAEGIELGAYDELVYEESDPNERILTIRRASLVTVTADGSTVSTYRTSGTIGDALDALGITVNDEDRINVSLNEPVNGDVQVKINRITTQTVTRESTIPFTVTEIPTQTLKKGKTRTLSEGEDGLRVTTVEQTLLDGVIIDETVVSEEVVQEPVAANVFVGDPDAPASQLVPDSPIELDENGNPINYKYKVTGKATAYSALGKPTKLKPGAVAMDLEDFPRGTKLYIKTPDGSFTYGYAEVRDTGTAMQEGLCLVDLFFNSYRESCLFGAKTVDIYVLE